MNGNRRQIIISDSSDMIVKVAEVIHAIEQVVKVFLELGKQILPVGVGFALEIGGATFAEVIIVMIHIRGRIEAARLTGAANSFMYKLQDAERYPTGMRDPMRQAAAQDFISDMAKLNVTGLTIESVLSGA